MKTFALIGGSGYIAPRHVEAIKHVGGDLIAVLDPYDGIGFIDKHFPNASYFKETERFDRHLDRLTRKGKAVDYIVICSPNYLHDSHIRLGLRYSKNIICEKPIVLKYEHLQSLQQIQQDKNINTILQLRLHPSIKSLREKYPYKDSYHMHDINLTYTTPRGLWYKYSWKGDEEKSGGVASNIGVHFFDMLIWIFGNVNAIDVVNTPTSSQGTLMLDRATVNFKLSIDKEDLPWDEWKPYRSITIDGEEVEFSEGFTDLHNKSYEQILSGNGFTLQDVESTVKLIEDIRYADNTYTSSKA